MIQNIWEMVYMDVKRDFFDAKPGTIIILSVVIP